jgi:hypothetical protein
VGGGSGVKRFEPLGKDGGGEGVVMLGVLGGGRGGGKGEAATRGSGGGVLGAEDRPSSPPTFPLPPLIAGNLIVDHLGSPAYAFALPAGGLAGVQVAGVMGVVRRARKAANNHSMGAEPKQWCTQSVRPSSRVVKVHHMATLSL